MRLALLSLGVGAVMGQLDVHRRSVLDSTASITSRSDSLPSAEFTLELGAKVSRPKYKHDLWHGLQQTLPPGAQVGPYFTATLAGAFEDGEHSANVTIGGQKFNLVVDTGSADPWVIAKGFTCENAAGQVVSRKECAFGPRYNPKASKTFVPLEGKSFNITYESGQHLIGPMGRDTIEIAGMVVKHQNFAPVDNAGWEGDGVTSGILGLAYRDITFEYNTSNPDDAVRAGPGANWIPYSPLFYTAIHEGVLKNPILSVAISRGTTAGETNGTYDPNQGYISFGGIVPVAVEPTFATVPVQKITLDFLKGPHYYFYQIDVQYDSPGSHNTTSQPILDTGTTLNYLPTHLVHEFAKAFDPPAYFDRDFGLFVVACNATVPKFDVIIGGVKFPIASVDQIWPIEEGNPLCVLGTQPGGTIESGSIFVLGSTFLHNVVMTFDAAKEEVTVSLRTPYKTND